MNILGLKYAYSVYKNTSIFQGNRGKRDYLYLVKRFITKWLQLAYNQSDIKYRIWEKSKN
jgi:hypothetical protein